LDLSKGKEMTNFLASIQDLKERWWALAFLLGISAVYFLRSLFKRKDEPFWPDSKISERSYMQFISVLILAAIVFMIFLVGTQ